MNWEDLISGARDSFGLDVPTPLEVLCAVFLSFFLNLLIGLVYKNTYRGTRYSQDYVHTLVIIGTVTTVLIMVVSGNVGIAFGMFAAFSLIRFRRNLGQARDLAFLFFAMATGMVVGARFYMMALVSTTILAALIYIMFKRDAFAPKRASHQLRIRVNNDIDYDEAFYENTYPLYLSGAPYPKGDKKLRNPYFAVTMNSRLQRKDEEGLKERGTLASISEPTHTVVFLERGMPGDKKTSPAQRGFDAGPKANPRAFAARHNQKGLLVFADGHAEAKAASDLISPAGQIRFPQVGIIWTRDPEEDPN